MSKALLSDFLQQYFDWKQLRSLSRGRGRNIYSTLVSFCAFAGAGTLVNLVGKQQRDEGKERELLNFRVDVANGTQHYTDVRPD